MLRVFNVICNIGLTEADFEAVEQEVSHTERTGLAIKVIKDLFFIGVSHDEKHNIIINPIGRIIKGLNNQFFNKDMLSPNSKILFKTLINFDVPNEIYTLHQIGQYRTADFEIKDVANNLEELKDIICDRFRAMNDDVINCRLGRSDYVSYSLRERQEQIEKGHKELLEKQLKAIYWLFGQPYNLSYKGLRNNLKRIVKVFERNNRRLAIILHYENYKKITGVFYFRREAHIDNVEVLIRSYNPKDRQYNYVDEGREIYENIWLDDSLKEKVTANELKLLEKRFDSFVFLTPELYAKHQKSLRLELMQNRQADNDNKLKDKLKDKLEKEFKKGRVIRGGITFSKDKIVSDEGIELKGDKILDFIEDNNIITTELNNPSFNAVAQSYIEYILDRTNKVFLQAKYDRVNLENIKTNFSVEKIKVEVVREVKNNYFFVNKIRIRIDELSEVVRSVLTFREQIQFDNFLKEVSKCSLRLKRAIENGISFKLEIKKSDDNCLVVNEETLFVKLKIVRNNSKNFLQLNDKLLPIKNISALFELEKEPNRSEWSRHSTPLLQRAIRLLYQAVKGIEPSDIQELIKIGKVNYKEYLKQQEERIERSKEFIRNAIKITDTIETSEGFIVKSKANNEYFIEKENLGIYVWNGRKEKYLCVVDVKTDITDEAGFNDAIAKRILLLRHDKMVADEIHTLKEYLQEKELEVEV